MNTRSTVAPALASRTEPATPTRPATTATTSAFRISVPSRDDATPILPPIECPLGGSRPWIQACGRGDEVSPRPLARVYRAGAAEEPEGLQRQPLAAACAYDLSG